MCECLDRGDNTAHVDKCYYADWKAWREHGKELLDAAEKCFCEHPQCRCHTDGALHPTSALAAALKKFGR